MRKILLFLISFAIIAMLDISTTFAQVQNQQQRADNGKPYTVAIHRLNNKALNDSLLIETEDTTNFFSRRTSVGKLKDYIGSNLPDTAFKNNIDTIAMQSEIDFFLTVDASGITKKASSSTVTTVNSFFYWTFNSDSLQYITKSDSTITVDSDGDTIVFECTYTGNGNYDYFFRKKQGGYPNFNNTNLRVTPVILNPTPSPLLIYPYLFVGYAGIGNGGSWQGSYYLSESNIRGYPTIETLTLTLRIDIIYK